MLGLRAGKASQESASEDSGRTDNFHAKKDSMGIRLWIEKGATASSVAVTLDMLRLAQRCQPERDWRLEIQSSKGGPVQLAEGWLSIQALIPCRKIAKL